MCVIIGMLAVDTFFSVTNYDRVYSELGGRTFEMKLSLLARMLEP